MGHVGLTPQTATMLGGYRAQGRTAARARQVLDDALALQEAGCFSIVFEAIPAEVTDAIMPYMEHPDHRDRRRPEHRRPGPGPARPARRSTTISSRSSPSASPSVKDEMRRGVDAYADEVRTRTFPAPEHTYGIAPEELERFRAELPTLRTRASAD